MVYYKYNWIRTENGQVTNQGDGVGATNYSPNQDNIKDFVRNLIEAPDAVISIPLISQISYEEYVESGGDPIYK